MLESKYLGAIFEHTFKRIRFDWYVRMQPELNEQIKQSELRHEHPYQVFYRSLRQNMTLSEELIIPYKQGQLSICFLPVHFRYTSGQVLIGSRWWHILYCIKVYKNRLAKRLWFLQIEQALIDRPHFFNERLQWLQQEDRNEDLRDLKEILEIKT